MWRAGFRATAALHRWLGKKARATDDSLIGLALMSTATGPVFALNQFCFRRAFTAGMREIERLYGERERRE